MLNMQNVKDIEITEGDVRTIHDKDSRLIWGRVAYNTKYAGDTYQQTYSGKNLFPLGTGSYTNHGFTSVYNADGSITVSGTADTIYANLTSNRVVNYEQGKTYTLSIKEALPCSIGAILTGSGTTREDINVNAGSTSGKRTLNQTHSTAALYIFNLTVGQSYSFTVYPMLEEGSIASPFEPYVGGIPAPNPDYPQPIQVVTGEQTVTVTGDGVSSQSYPISLGSMELCKTGNYQDKIFNNDPNEDWYDPDLEDNAWYVHKEVGTYTFGGTESWTAAAVGDGYVFYTTVITDYATQNNAPISKYFSGVSNVASYSATPRNSIAFINISGQTTPRFYVRYNNNFSSADELKTFMEENNPIVYYALATATDTKITDATLVGQLNAVHEWLTRYGYNATVTGNLPIIISKTNL